MIMLLRMLDSLEIISKVNLSVKQINPMWTGGRGLVTFYWHIELA